MRWLSRKTARNSEDRALSAGSVPPAMLSSAPGGAVTPDGAMRIADAYACVRALADAAASLPLHVYRRTEQGRVRSDGRTAELIERPAPAMTTAALVGQLVAHLNLHGNAYLGKARSEGRIEQLVALLPDRVTPRIESGQPRYELRDEKGRVSDHGVADIVHVKALTTDGVVGLSPVRQARQALGLDRSLTEHASNFFENDARPAGIVKVGAGGSEALERLRGAWEGKHKGADKAGNIAVVSGEVDYTSVAMPLDDAQFLEQRKLAATEIARIFRVPPWIVGAEDGSSQTYSNVEQQSLAFATYALRPWLTLIEQAISADRDLCPGSLYVEFLIDALLRADAATRADVYTKALDPITGWMTREEVRRLENLDPEPNPPTPAAPPAEAVPTNGGTRA